MKICSVLIALLAPMVFAGEKPKFTVEPLKDSVRITITGAANVEPLLIGSAAPIEFFISPSDLEGVIRVSSHSLVALSAISETVWTYSPAFEKQTYSIPYHDLKMLGRYERAEGKYLGPVSAEYAQSHDWKTLLKSSKLEILWHAKWSEAPDTSKILLTEVVPLADSGPPPFGPFESTEP